MKRIVDRAAAIAAILILAFYGSSMAYLAEIGITPLMLQSGSRPLGMGGAFTGLSNDVNSTFYNPGGLPWAKGISVNVSDLNNISASQAYPTGYGSTLGIAVVQNGATGIPLVNGQTADFNSSVLVLSAGSKLSAIPPLAENKIAQSLGLGASVKAMIGSSLRETGMSDRTAQGWEFDLGGIYRLNRFTTLGFSGTNLLPYNFLGGGKITWDNGTLEATPAAVRLGGSMKVIGDVWSPLYVEDEELTLAFDIESLRSQSPNYYVGAEWAFGGTYFYRLGYVNRPQKSSVCFGAGIKADAWGFDIASAPNPMTGSNAVSFSVLYFPEEWVFVRRPVKQYAAMKIQDPVKNISPDDNLITYDDHILVSGQAKPGVEVYLNEQAVNVDPNLNFSVMEPLRIGKNLVVVDAFYEGAKLSVERKIFRKAKVIVAEEKQVDQQIKVAKTPEQKKQLEQQKAQIAEKKDRLETLVTMGVVEVSPEASFSIEAPVTRGELASWLVKAANYPLPRITRDPFSDVPKEHPLAVYIKVAVDRGLIKAYPDRSFRPNATISVAEGAEIFKKFGVIR
ncbi:MAG TPA: S-layer homology domain-containing protein [Candidatus Omnitrophota bacterium]|nr:S-layer homology domain-containing protein [Candidatus Omnitrophota bacterium]